jgi:hypothetical protein
MHVRGVVFILCDGHGQKVRARNTINNTGLSASDILPTGLIGTSSQLTHSFAVLESYYSNYKKIYKLH